MGLSFEHIGFANLFENGHNFITFSLMGMLIVFAGLSLISIYITLLPKILNLPNLIKADKKSQWDEQEPAFKDESDAELLLAVAVALHLEQTGGDDYEKITWERHDQKVSSWLTAGRMRGLAVRSHLPDRRI